MSSFDKCHAVKLVACPQAPGHRNLFLFPPPVSAPRVFFISQHHQRKRTAAQSMQFTLSCNVCAFWDWSCVFHILVFGTSVSVFARYRIPGHNWFAVFVQFYFFNPTAAVWMNWTVWRIFFIFKDCPSFSEHSSQVFLLCSLCHTHIFCFISNSGIFKSYVTRLRFEIYSPSIKTLTGIGSPGIT